MNSKNKLDEKMLVVETKIKWCKKVNKILCRWPALVGWTSRNIDTIFFVNFLVMFVTLSVSLIWTLSSEEALESLSAKAIIFVFGLISSPVATCLFLITQVMPYNSAVSRFVDKKVNMTIRYQKELERRKTALLELQWELVGFLKYNRQIIGYAK